MIEQTQFSLRGCNANVSNGKDNEIICDFYLPGPPRIAIECKANPNRDWDRTLTTVAILKKHFDLSTVLIVVPNAESIRKTDRDRINEDDGRIVPLSQLKKTLMLSNNQFNP